jgi:hypothetical protein
MTASAGKDIKQPARMLLSRRKATLPGKTLILTPKFRVELPTNRSSFCFIFSEKIESWKAG